MAQVAMHTATAELLNAIYKNVKMASESLLTLMPKVKDEKLKNDMTVQLSVYDGFASRAAKLIAEEGAKPKDEKTVTKLTAKMGMMMSTMKDSTTGHLVDMLVDGTNMGVEDITKAIREAEKRNVSGEPIKLAKNLCDYQEKTLEDLKNLRSVLDQ